MSPHEACDGTEERSFHMETAHHPFDRGLSRLN